MSETFLTRMASSGTDQLVQVIVQYSSAETMQAFNDTAAAAEVGIAMGQQFSLIPAQPVSGTPQALMELQKQPFVERIWEDLPVYALLDVSAPKVHAPQLWDLGFDGTGVKVAVIDTGIDPDHPDFGDRILESRDFTGSKPGGVDGHGHGTHVAGIIAGSGEASGGRYIGLAPQARLLVAKVLRDNGSGMTSDVMAGVDWAVQQGAHVLNLSLGSDGPCDGSDALSTMCDEAVNQGVVVCVAAGNSGPGASTVGSPGCARTVITIGATNDDDQITSFSSRGPTSDGRVKPDLCFPGFNIIAARAQGTSMGSVVDARYTSASGTSMATPHAAGAAAQLLEALPGVTPAEIKQRLMATAINLGLDANTQGTGRGDVKAAYEYMPGTPPPPPPPPGGCSPFGSGASTQSSGARAFWWILGILLLLCLCVTCASAALIAVGVANY
jgi:serine protease AprX